MGGTTFSRDTYAARTSMRYATAKKKGILYTDAVFSHDRDVRDGRASGAHNTLDPKGVAVRESRDSDAHPVSVPIIVCLDTTGSMMSVPAMIQAELPKLMGRFLDDKASGNRYLGEGHPAVMVAAVDDHDAMRGESGTLQVGQFESGIEVDDNISNLWMTGHGGGTYDESYELMLWFAAQHTVHDHWEKRKRKGYLFFIGDEHAYDPVRAERVRNVIGSGAQDVPLKDVVAQVQERYHVFFIIPNMTLHYNDPELHRYWSDLLGQQYAIRLEDPQAICDTIVSAVAICEEHFGIADLEADGVAVSNALVPLAEAGAEVASLAGLPFVPGSSGGTERL